MTSTTPINGLRMAELTDSPPNIQTAFGNIGTDLDTRLVPRYTSTANRDAAIPSPIEGMVCYVSGTGSAAAVLMIYSGSAWVPIFHNNPFAYKASNETVTASTTYQADNDLTVAVRANTIYTVEFFGIATGEDAGDFKFRFTYPTSAALSGGTLAMFASIGGGTDFAGSGYWRAYTNDSSSPSSDLFAGIPDTNSTSILYKGLLVVAGTAGNLALEWAQNVSDATGTTLQIGSYLRLVRVV